MQSIAGAISKELNSDTDYSESCSSLPSTSASPVKQSNDVVSDGSASTRSSANSLTSVSDAMQNLITAVKSKYRYFVVQYGLSNRNNFS